MKGDLMSVTEAFKFTVYRNFFYHKFVWLTILFVNLFFEL